MILGHDTYVDSHVGTADRIRQCSDHSVDRRHRVDNNTGPSESHNLYSSYIDRCTDMEHSPPMDCNTPSDGQTHRRRVSILSNYTDQLLEK